jgi:hypothetical protein
LRYELIARRIEANPPADEAEWLHALGKLADAVMPRTQEPGAKARRTQGPQ